MRSRERREAVEELRQSDTPIDQRNEKPMTQAIDPTRDGLMAATTGAEPGAASHAGPDDQVVVRKKRGGSRPGAQVGRKADRTRKLHVGHFAFMRAVVQGISMQDSWNRYLSKEGGRSDPLLIQQTVAWIRQEFAAVSRREHRHGTARLLEFDLRKLLDPGPMLPSLEDFAVEHQLEDFSEAEQTEAYEAHYRAELSRAKRRRRLMQRQLEALQWLQQLVAQPPSAGDAVGSWLSTSLSAHLEAADIFTLAQLVERINGVGNRWHAGIPGLGPAKARRIEAWLKEHERTIGMGLGAHIERPRHTLFKHELERVVQPATDIRPLEKFRPPAELDGSKGLYRRPQAHCLIQATNDYQAILAWLRTKAGLTEDQKKRVRSRRRQRDTGVEQAMDWLQYLSHTQRSYRKEAERFLLWVIVQRGKAMSSVTAEDCAEYRDFLADPQPRSHWCGTRARERWSPLWRPFEGPLKPSAQRQAVSILSNLYAFLGDQNYLMGNPWSAVTPPRNAMPRIDVGRSFTQAQWKFIEAETAQGQGTESGRADPDRQPSLMALRLRFALELLYATGLRREEVVAAQLDDLRFVTYPSDGDAVVEGWMLTVLGKGQRLREVPVPDSVVEQLKVYLAARGLHPEPDNLGNRGAYLLGWHAELEADLKQPGADDPRRGILPDTLYTQLKRFFARCAGKLRLAGDDKAAERFDNASTHWLRHTHASHAIAAGVPVQIEQQNLGHVSLDTTTVYVTTEDKRRMQAMRDFWAKR